MYPPLVPTPAWGSKFSERGSWWPASVWCPSVGRPGEGVPWWCSIPGEGAPSTDRKMRHGRHPPRPESPPLPCGGSRLPSQVKPLRSNASCRRACSRLRETSQLSVHVRVLGEQGEPGRARHPLALPGVRPLHGALAGCVGPCSPAGSPLGGTSLPSSVSLSGSL